MLSTPWGSGAGGTLCGQILEGSRSDWATAHCRLITPPVCYRNFLLEAADTDVSPLETVFPSNKRRCGLLGSGLCPVGLRVFAVWQQVRLQILFLKICATGLQRWANRLPLLQPSPPATSDSCVSRGHSLMEDSSQCVPGRKEGGPGGVL
uniref:Uncharacterized protein n=1 Tax=Rhinopithecus bieti TaxID=61621 RepID=A0A2K6MI19_RHIBE